MVQKRKSVKLSTIVILVVFILFIVGLRKLPAQSSGMSLSFEQVSMSEFISKYDVHNEVLPLGKRPSITQTIRTPEHMVELINKVRAYYNLPPLTLSPVLNQTARSKACDMQERKYFSHNEPPDNKKPWHWFYEAGYDYQYAGENLAKDRIDQYSEMIGFMDSPDHRENILSTDYKEVGVGICGTYTVQHFGAR